MVGGWVGGGRRRGEARARACVGHIQHAHNMAAGWLIVCVLYVIFSAAFFF